MQLTSYNSVYYNANAYIPWMEYTTQLILENRANLVRSKEKDIAGSRSTEEA